MSQLTIYKDDNPGEPIMVTQIGDEIRHALSDRGVLFDRWDDGKVVAPGASNEEIISLYQAEIDQLVAQKGYQSFDVISLDSSAAGVDLPTMRAKFLSEHTHSEDEVRYFVKGSGLFVLHIDDRVYQLLCEKNDLIGVPAGIKHWFDMGEHPNFTALRFFNNPDGWIANYTGSDIADAFPKMVI